MIEELMPDGGRHNPHFSFPPIPFVALTASPIAAVADAAALYHQRLDELRTEADELDRLKVQLKRANEADLEALSQALATGSVLPERSRDVLTLRIDDANRRVEARTRLAGEAQYQAVETARLYAAQWLTASAARHGEARREYQAALSKAREAAIRLLAAEQELNSPADIIRSSTEGKVVRFKALAGFNIPQAQVRLRTLDSLPLDFFDALAHLGEPSAATIAATEVADVPEPDVWDDPSGVAFIDAPRKARLSAAAQITAVEV